MIKPIDNNKATLLFSLLIIGWIIALLIESSQPPLPILGAIKGLDKAAHFLAFGVLSLLVCCLSFTLRPKAEIPLLSMPLLIATLSGILEESYQLFVPGRAASLGDFLADVCGAVFAIILANRAALSLRVSHGFRT